MKGLSIYDDIPRHSPYWLTAEELEMVLDKTLRKKAYTGLKLRTRSKAVKADICEVLGFTVPKSFRKTQPKFPALDFDTYTQQSNNLQIWNEELQAGRRYVLIRLDHSQTVTNVKVVTGADLALLDTTGKLTTKYQARLDDRLERAELAEKLDSERLVRLLRPDLWLSGSPTNDPVIGGVLPIAAIFEKLQPLIGFSFEDPGPDQERSRGTLLHGEICKLLGYKSYADSGRFPDVRGQLLEVKLQTSPTIDLGLISPDSEEILDLNLPSDIEVRARDIRYLVCQADVEGNNVIIRGFILITGKTFYRKFRQFGGNVTNSKIQITLPKNFFDSESLVDQ